MPERADGPWVALDLETTGLHPGADRIVEIAAVRFDASGRELDHFCTLVDPGCPMPAAARAIHGLGDDDLRGRPTAAEALPEFLRWLGPEGEPASRPMAHNAAFDAAFLGRELVRAGLPIPDLCVLDTLDLARRAFPAAPNHRLETLAAWLGLTAPPTHRALDDSRAVRALWDRSRAVLPHEPDDPRVARYAVRDPGDAAAPALPVSWAWLGLAIAAGATVEIVYEGGSRGLEPRRLTPLSVEKRGGALYLVAMCHFDGRHKAFRLDRIRDAGPRG
jgi:DNA polymerase III epsilon subunit-like protein